MRAAVEEALEPGEVARVVNDPRSGPTLVAVPEAMAAASDAHGQQHHHHHHEHEGFNAPPGRTILIPPTSTEPGSIRPETVAAVENTGSDVTGGSRRSWWPFGRKKEEEDALPGPGAVPLEPGLHPRDYAPGHGDPARQGELDSGQYAEDIVDWLDVIGARLPLFFVRPH